MTSLSKFFDGILFLLSSLVTSLSFMSVSSQVLELWQFSFMRDWPEILKTEIHPSGFYPMSGDWDKLGIPNLARMSLVKCYQMLQNAKVTPLNVSELLRENQQGGAKITTHPTSTKVWIKEREYIEILKILGLINYIEEFQKIYNYSWKKKHKSRI